MNAFVNFKKRSVSLPRRGKELSDVLVRSNRPPKDALMPEGRVERGFFPRGCTYADKSVVEQFVMLVLMAAQQDCATKLVVGTAPKAGGDVPIRCEVEGRWHDLVAFPSGIRSRIVRVFGGMASFPKGRFPKKGDISLPVDGIQVKWRVLSAAVDAECILIRTAG